MTTTTTTKEEEETETTLNSIYLVTLASVGSTRFHISTPKPQHLLHHITFSDTTTKVWVGSMVFDFASVAVALFNTKRAPAHPTPKALFFFKKNSFQHLKPYFPIQKYYRKYHQKILYTLQDPSYTYIHTYIYMYVYVGTLVFHIA